MEGGTDGETLRKLLFKDLIPHTPYAKLNLYNQNNRNQEPRNQSRNPKFNKD